MLGEATLDASETFLGEAIRLPIQIAPLQAVLQLLMESDVEGLIGAGRYERSNRRSQPSNRITAVNRIWSSIVRP